MHSSLKELLGEATGTFIIVFLGCGAVAVSILFNGLPHIAGIAAVWGAAVMIAIYTVRTVCGAHFNPAVSIAMTIAGRFQKRKLMGYFTAQFLGSMMAATILYAALSGPISDYEKAHHLLRGAPESVATARMFGEFYAPNPVLYAMLAECAGTFLLTAGIFMATHERGKKNRAKQAPLYIGATLMLLICFFASVTQAGFNPARDLGPRLIAYMAGWRAAAFPGQAGGFFWVYILAPVMGAALAALLYHYYVKRTLNTTLKMQYESE